MIDASKLNYGYRFIIFHIYERLPEIGEILKGVIETVLFKLRFTVHFIFYHQNTIFSLSRIKIYIPLLKILIDSSKFTIVLVKNSLFLMNSILCMDLYHLSTLAYDSILKHISKTLDNDDPGSIALRRSIKRRLDR